MFAFEIKKKYLIKDINAVIDAVNNVDNTGDPYAFCEEVYRFLKRKKASDILGIPRKDRGNEIFKTLQLKGLDKKVHTRIERHSGKNILKCCNPVCDNSAIKNSHVLQKNGILKSISSDGLEIYQSKIDPMNPSKRVKRISLKSASTFPGFCSDCEINVFSEAENISSSISRDKALPLLWRGMCYNRYRRAVEACELSDILRTESQLYKLSDEYNDVTAFMAYVYGVKRAIHSYRVTNKWVDEIEKELWFGKSSLDVFAIRVPSIPFAGAGGIVLPINLRQEVDENLHSFFRQCPSLCYTTLLADNVRYLVFSAKRSDRKGSRILNELMNLPRVDLMTFLPSIIFGGSDTVFISQKFWENMLNIEDIELIKFYQALPFPDMAVSNYYPVSGTDIEEVVCLVSIRRRPWFSVQADSFGFVSPWSPLLCEPCKALDNLF